MAKQAKFLKNESEKAPLILVVGNHSDHSSGIDEYLIEAGFRLRQVIHGENELEVFSSVSPNLILLDTPTPDKDAYETCRQIRETPGGERIPILFMIGAGDDAAVELAFAAGATDFIGKPICFTVLKARIRNLLKPCHAEQRFTTLAQSATDGIISIDDRGIIRYVNRAMETIFGYSASEIEGRDLSLLMPEEFGGLHTLGIQRYLETRQPKVIGQTVELQGLHKNGAVFPMELSLSVTETAVETSFTGIIRNISKRVQAEEELREREIFLNTLLDAIPIPIFYKDRDGRYLGFNPAFETFFGAAREKLIGKSVFDINPPKLAEIYHEKDMELIEGGGLQQYQTQVQNALGDLRDVIFNKAALLDIRGDVSGIIGAIFDITGRLQAEIALQESQARYAHIFENAGVGIWVEDFSQIKASIDELKAQGVNDFEAYFQENPEFIQQAAQLIQIRDVNQATLDLFGAKNKAELLASIDAVLVPETQKILRNEILAIANQMRYFKGETVNRTLQGELIHILVTIVFPEDQDRFEDVLVSMMDISERVQAEKELQSLTETLEERVRQRTYELQVLHELSQEISYTLDYEELFHRMLSHLHRVVDYDVAMSLLFEDDTPRLYQRLNRNLAPDVLVDIQSQLIATFERMQPGREIFSNELSIRNLESLSIDQAEDDVRNETPVTELNSIFQVPLIARSNRQIVGLLFVGAERAAAFSEDSVRLLYTLATQASLSLERLRSLMYVEQQRLESLVERIPDGIVLIDKNKKVVMENPAGRQYMDHLTDESGRLSLKHLRGHDIEALLHPREDGFPHEIFVNTNQHQIFEVNSRSIETGPEKGGWVLTLRDVTWERDLLASEQTRRRELDALYRLSREMAATDNLDNVLENIAQQSVESLHVSFCRVLLTRDAAFHCMAVFPAREFNDALGVNQQEAKSTWPIYRDVLKENLPLMISNNHPQIPDSVSTTLKRGIAQLLCLVPMRVGDEPIGILMLGEARDIAREPFTEEKLRLASAIGDQAASAIHRATLHFQTQQRLNRILALRQIDIAITSSVDIEVTLSVLVKIIQKELNVDAVNILRLNPHGHILETAMSCGFSTNNIKKLNMRVGEGFAGRAAIERQSIRVDELSSEIIDAPYMRALETETFHAYFGIPLMAKGKINGVLEVYHRQPLPTDAEWEGFLETLAGQTAIAIDSADMFKNLQRSNMELMLAYDATIEGWSNALELRDMETEGHSQRVTRMTIALARLMGVSEDDLIHIRRGALLHDIGKMGIPDYILHKPGPLTDDEWTIMRRHPKLAYDLLSPIEFLRQALHIPASHHEKWDGSGYPQGIAGEAIPLAARIFAIVDVWDALRSDRPYRDAWPEEKVLAHIQEDSGTHFDPQVVDAFMKLIRGQSTAR